MNNKIYIVDRNGNQVIVEGISYIELKGDGYSNEYLFYTLNEIVNGDLNKIYVAKVNNDNLTIDDSEWDNVKKAMLAITHQEEVVGLSYKNMFDEKGEGKVFKTEIPRKLALKLDKLTGIKDAYKIAMSNPENKSDTAAVGGQFIDPELLVDKGNENSIDKTNTPSAFDGTIQPSVPEAVPQVTVEQAPVVEAPPAVEPAPVQTVTEVPAETPAVTPSVPEPAPVVETPAVEEAPAPAVTNQVVEAPASTTESFDDLENEIKTIAPTPIPEVITEEPKEDGFAIPVSKPNINVTEENDIFNEIIKELSLIKNQNEEIKESIRKLQNNIANINTNLSQQEITNSQGNYDGMINTNMANTTEDVAAIDITSNGTVVIPSFEQAQQTAQQTASVISTNVINPENTIIESPIPGPSPETTITQPVENPTLVADQPVEVAPAPIAPVIPNLPTAPAEPVAPVTPVVETPVSEVPAPVIEQPQTAVTEVPELPQILPDVPMASDTPNIIMPNGNPLADLPPVQMPMGVSAGDDSSAVGAVGTIPE